MLEAHMLPMAPRQSRLRCSRLCRQELLPCLLWHPCSRMAVTMVGHILDPAQHIMVSLHSLLLLTSRLEDPVIWGWT